MKMKEDITPRKRIMDMFVAQKQIEFHSHNIRFVAHIFPVAMMQRLKKELKSKRISGKDICP
jgi:hypothetical protein